MAHLTEEDLRAARAVLGHRNAATVLALASHLKSAATAVLRGLRPSAGGDAIEYDGPMRHVQWLRDAADDLENAWFSSNSASEASSSADDDLDEAPSAAPPPDPLDKILNELIDQIDECGSYVDLEGGQGGGGIVVQACEALGRPLPQNLAEWLAIDGAEDQNHEV